MRDQAEQPSKKARRPRSAASAKDEPNNKKTKVKVGFCLKCDACNLGPSDTQWDQFVATYKDTDPLVLADTKCKKDAMRHKRHFAYLEWPAYAKLMHTEDLKI